MAWGINLNQSGNEWNGTTLHPQGGRNSRVHHQRKKFWLVFWGERGVILVIIWPLNWSSKKNECSPLLSYPQAKCQNCCCSIKMPSHKNVRTAETVRKFGWTVLPHPPWSSDLAPSDSPHLFIIKTACEDPITQTKRHCKTAFSSGCRGRRITFTGQECILLLKGGRRKGTKMEAVLKNNCAFNNVVNFCEIFTCLMLSVSCSKK